MIKSVLILAIFLALILAVPFANAIESWPENDTILNRTCTDSDGGLNYYLKGNVTTCSISTNASACGTAPDFCIGSILKEGYCENSQIKVAKFTCPFGCSNGACIQNSTTNITEPVEKNLTCRDTDETTYPTLNPFFRGTATAGSDIQTDFCGAQPYLIEFLCRNETSTTVDRVSFHCPYTCSNGACTNESAVSNNTCAKKETIQRGPLGNPGGTGEFEKLRLDISQHPEILEYRIQWFGGYWSPWYTPGQNDIDWKTNLDGSKRRAWAYFDDHVHEMIICKDKETKKYKGIEISTDRQSYKFGDIIQITGLAKNVNDESITFSIQRPDGEIEKINSKGIFTCQEKTSDTATNVSGVKPSPRPQPASPATNAKPKSTVKPTVASTGAVVANPDTDTEGGESTTQAGSAFSECNKTAIKNTLCTATYEPVCAPTVNPCLVAPCPVFNVTYNNSCLACKSAYVSNYRKGQCEILKNTTNVTCPTYTSPAPYFCVGGTLKPVNDSNGCPAPPKCVCPTNMKSENNVCISINQTDENCYTKFTASYSKTDMKGKYRITAEFNDGQTSAPIFVLVNPSVGPGNDEDLIAILVKFDTLRAKMLESKGNVYKLVRFYQSSNDTSNAEKYFQISSLLQQSVQAIDDLKDFAAANRDDIDLIKEQAKETLATIKQNMKSIIDVLLQKEEPKVCAADVKLCPDGVTYVSRDPNNNCEFRQCPASNQTIYNIMIEEISGKNITIKNLGTEPVQASSLSFFLKDFYLNETSIVAACPHLIAVNQSVVCKLLLDCPSGSSLVIKAPGMSTQYPCVEEHLTSTNITSAECIGALDLSNLQFSNGIVSLKITDNSNKIGLFELRAIIEYNDSSKNKQYMLSQYGISDPLPATSTEFLLIDTNDMQKPYAIVVISSTCPQQITALKFR